MEWKDTRVIFKIIASKANPTPNIGSKTTMASTRITAKGCAQMEYLIPPKSFIPNATTLADSIKSTPLLRKSINWGSDIGFDILIVIVFDFILFGRPRSFLFIDWFIDMIDWIFFFYIYILIYFFLSSLSCAFHSTPLYFSL